MKTLFVSEKGDCMGVAVKMQQNGDEVAACILNGDGDYIGLGMVDKASNWRSAARDADVITLDGWHMCHIHRQALERCDTVVGASMVPELLSRDRLRQIELFERGVPYVKRKVFDTPSLALDLTSNFKKPVVVKAASKNISRLVMVCSTVEQYKHALNQFPGDSAIVVENFYDQAVTFTKMFGPEGWAAGYVVSVKHSFMGCACVVSRKESKAVVGLFEALTSFVQVVGYAGRVHLECVIVDGSPALVDIKFGFDPGISTCLLEISNGSSAKDRYALLIRVTDPCYPRTPIDGDNRGAPIIVKNDDLRGIYLQDVYKSDTMYHYASNHGVVTSIVGTGSTEKRAAGSLLKSAARVSAYGAVWPLGCEEVLQDRIREVVRGGFA